MPLPAATKTITLESVGAPEFNVTFRRMGAIPFGEIDKFREQLTSIEKAAEESGKDIDNKRVELTIAHRVVEWDIQTPDGFQYPLPKHEPGVVWKIPLVYVEYISAMITEDSFEDGRGDVMDLVWKRVTNSVLSSSPEALGQVTEQSLKGSEI